MLKKHKTMEERNGNGERVSGTPGGRGIPVDGTAFQTNQSQSHNTKRSK